MKWLQVRSIGCDLGYKMLTQVGSTSEVKLLKEVQNPDSAR